MGWFWSNFRNNPFCFPHPTDFKESICRISDPEKVISATCAPWNNKISRPKISKTIKNKFADYLKIITQVLKKYQTITQQLPRNHSRISGKNMPTPRRHRITVGSSGAPSVNPERQTASSAYQRGELNRIQQSLPWVGLANTVSVHAPWKIG